MFQTLPGFREFYPEDCARRNFIFSKWREAAKTFCFEEFDGPVLESLELLTAKSGPEIASQLFNFTDKGGREVTLRPELTPTLARMVGAKAGSIRRPVRWFGIAENFRYEKPQKGRLRSHYQLNADILGEAGVGADAEIIALLIHTLCSFGLSATDFVIRLSDRNLWLALLESKGITGGAVVPVLSIIDKLERDDPESVVKKLNEAGVEDADSFFKEITALAEIRSLEELEAFFSSRQVEQGEFSASGRLESWKALLEILKASGAEDFIRVDLGIVRGLAYYTGFVFEAFQTKGKARALAGGGRYDHLVEKLGGQPMPAVGFGMGDVTLNDLLLEKKIEPPAEGRADIYVVIGGADQRPMALKTVAKLRKAGFRVDFPIKDQGFGKQFKTADQSGAKFALVVGEQEVKDRGVRVKNLSSGEESFLTEEKIITFLTGFFNC
ncbi:histidine--tRNA ligase [Rubellicoccus peritrichatus]|uniref:Histidine--tRNA ligase n=1 Tax=Rubellicoccus peritrichatus TaxID=3080537 RepID=A0AAQ3L5C3_9BACT|nr:histidine--tRNA ligase [Puniceicoccus sp. CR14]WOO39455.1 histidine--tRNA ligase [Puniceicoccus sp. CR14]